MLWFEKVDNLTAAAALARRRRYGVICVAGGEFHHWSFRPWPKLISRLEIATLGRWKHAQGGDYCRLYYNLPVTSPGFLTLAYVESTAETSWKTLRRSVELLDWVATIRRVHASVCELSNERISDRVMRRVGWESHCEHLAGRHFIKRFYGEYPQHPWLPPIGANPGHFRRESLDCDETFDAKLSQIGLVDEKVGC